MTLKARRAAMASRICSGSAYHSRPSSRASCSAWKAEIDATMSISSVMRTTPRDRGSHRTSDEVRDAQPVQRRRKRSKRDSANGFIVGKRIAVSLAEQFADPA